MKGDLLILDQGREDDDGLGLINGVDVDDDVLDGCLIESKRGRKKSSVEAAGSVEMEG